MNKKCNSKIIEQNDIDYLSHDKSVLRVNFVGCLYCYLTLLSKVAIVRWNIPYYHIYTIYTILPCIENVQTVSSIKVQFLQYKAQNYLHNLVLLHVAYSFITNSLLGLMSLAKCLRLLTLCNIYCISIPITS